MRLPGFLPALPWDLSPCPFLLLAVAGEALPQNPNWSNVIITGLGILGTYFMQKKDLTALKQQLSGEKARYQKLLKKMVGIQRKLAHTQKLLDVKQQELQANTAINSMLVDAIRQTPDDLGEVLKKLPRRRRDSAGSGPDLLSGARFDG